MFTTINLVLVAFDTFTTAPADSEMAKGHCVHVPPCLCANQGRL